MTNLKKAAAALFLTAFISACGNGGGSGDKTAPTVSLTSPTSGAANISVNTIITINFSEAMDCTTITDTAFLLSSSDGAAVPGTVSCDASTATFALLSSLNYGTTYTVTATAGVKDTASNALTSDYTWSFTTGASTWTGIRQLGTESSDISEDIVVDSSGNVYLTGETEGSLDGNTNAGEFDFFVVKYDSNGGKEWTRQLGTEGKDIPKDIAVDTSGNVFVTGSTYAGLDGNTSAGNYDLFVVKYDSGGVKQWTSQLGTENNDLAYGIALDSSGYIYVTGRTSGGLDGNTNAGSSDLFLVKYDTSGTKQWTSQFGTGDTDYATGIAVDDTNGYIYITGYTEGSLNEANAGSHDIFVAQYDSNGTNLWTHQLGTANSDIATGIAVSSTGYVYITGYTEGSLNETNSGSYDLFIAQFDSSGTNLWKRQLGTASSDVATGIAVDNSGVYVTGTTQGGLSGDYQGGNDLFVIKLAGNGTTLWTKQPGTISDDYGTGIALDGSGNVYVSGRTEGDLDGNVSAGSSDLFVVKYDSSGNLQ